MEDLRSLGYITLLEYRKTCIYTIEMASLKIKSLNDSISRIFEEFHKAGYAHGK